VQSVIPTTWEAGAGVPQVPGQPEQHNKTLSQKYKVWENFQSLTMLQRSGGIAQANTTCSVLGSIQKRKERREGKGREEKKREML
jgi:hypothetical protein